MAMIALPPKPPAVAVDDGGNLGRTYFRLRIFGLTTSTVLITTWFIMLGLIPAILGIVIAKHILVAILVMGLGINTKPPT